MSSWLSGGLSQFSSITDQISSFTKDVLTETTEEIEDPTAELQVARRKIEHLEEVNNHYKTEWEKLQKHTEEVRERAETAECQIAAISQEYRKLIQEKDSELCRLRSEAVSLKEQHRKIVSGGGESSQSPLKELAAGNRFFPESSEDGSRGRGGEGVWEAAVLEPVSVVEGEGGGGGGEGEWGEYHDFGDIISSQGEINRLQLELSKVKVESQHWRTLAEEKGYTGGAGPVETELASLREQVEDLQLCLQRERGQHQHELSTLEAAHNEKIRSITQSSQAALKTETLIQVQLQDAIRDDPISENDTIRGSLLSALEEVSLIERAGEGREESDVVRSLRSELEASREKSIRLEGELEQLLLKMEEEQGEMKREKETAEKLQLELQSLKAALEHEQGSAGDTIDKLRGEVRRLEEDNSRLQTQEQVTRQLQAELRDSQSRNEGLKAEIQVLVTENSDLSNTITQLNSSLSEQKETTQQLYCEVEQLKHQFTLEKETYTHHVEQERKKLMASIAELQTSVSEHEQCIETLRGQYECSQREAETLTKQIGDLVAELQSKDHQLEELQGQELNENVDRDGTNVDTKLIGTEPQAVPLMDIHHVEPSSSTGNVESTEVSELREKLEVESTRNEHLQSLLKRLTEEHDGEVAQLVAEKEGLEREIGRLEHELKESQRVNVATTSSAVGETARIEKGVPSSMVAPGVEVDREMHSMLEDLQQSNSEKEATINQLNILLDSMKTELEGNVKKSETETAILCERLKEVEERERKVTEVLSRVQLEADSLRERLQTSEEQNTKLQHVLLERESRVTQLETESRETRLQLSQVAAELNMAEKNVREKETMIEHCKRNLQEVGKLLSAREEEVASLQRECEERNTSESRAEPSESVHRANESTAALELVTKERDELLVSVRAKQREVEDVGIRLSEAQATLSTTNKKFQQVTSENAELAQTVERSKREMDSVKSERDALTKRISTLEETVQAAREDLNIKQTECSKLSKQLEHLKAHLVQVEEQYVQDALKADEREREERRRAEQLQETLRNTSYTGQQENLQTKAQVSALEEQLHALAEQRDDAILQLSSAREEAENSAAALRNLQSVLEQFQRDQSSELSVALKRSQTELATALADLESLRSHSRTVQEQLLEARASTKEIDVLRHQLVEQEKRKEELRQEVTGLQATLHKTEEAMEKLMREEGGRVDQNLVKNLVVGYVQASDRKKPEVLNLIAKILDFAPAELEQVQGHKGSWLRSFWSRATTPSPTSPKVFIQGGSLSQLFVSFLETESTPTLSSSLPSGYSRLDPPPAGRVDPRTDPDRPSRATTASLPHHPPHSTSLPLHPPAASSCLPGPHPSTRPSVLPDSHPIPIHSNIDSQRQPDTGTTPGLHSNSALPVSTSSTNPTGTFSSLSLLPSAPTLSPIPPTSRTTTLPISSTAPHDSLATATITPSQDKRTPPAQNRHQSYQSSILKNLLS